VGGWRLQPDTLILHWNGTAWSKVPSPSPGPKGNFLTSVSAVSPTDAWAVGYSRNSTCFYAATLSAARAAGYQGSAARRARAARSCSPVPSTPTAASPGVTRISLDRRSG
jgi:hypothetical protein